MPSIGNRKLKMMKALYFDDKLSLREVPEPKPAPARL